MLNVVPRPQAAALVWVFLGWTLSSEVAIAAKPRDFGTDTAPKTGRVATPFSVSSTQVTIGNTPVCTAPLDQGSQSMVGDGSGSSLDVWADYRSGNLDIYAQKLNPAGTNSWVKDGVPVCKNVANQMSPKAVSDGSGGVIVVWEDARPGTTKDIYAQRLDAFGAPMWTSNGVAVCSAAGDQLAPVIVTDGMGGAVIAWTDSRGSSPDVYAQRINGAGAPQWTANGVALCTAADVQHDLAIATDFNHGAYVAWQDLRTGDPDIYGVHVDAAGAPLVPDGLLLCNATGVQETPVISTDGAGGAIVTWADRRSGNYDIYAQRMNGVVEWAANGVQLCGATGDQQAPRSCSDGAGGAILVWQDLRGGSTIDLYAQRVSPAGASQWVADGVGVCLAANDQTMPEIQRDPAGGAVISWADGRSGTSGLDVYAQRLNGAGGSLWTADGVQLCDAPSTQDAPVTMPDGVGGALVVWHDSRGSYSDLYGQQIDASGQIANQCAGLDTLRESVSQALSSAQNYRVFYNQFQNFPVYFWAGIAVRGDGGGDWDIEAYDTDGFGLQPYPSCFGYSLAGSSSASDVDFIMFDENETHTPPGIYGIRPYRYSGTGNSLVEFDGGKSSMVVCTNADPNHPVGSPVNWTDVIDVYDVGMTGGVTYTFDFVRTPSDAALKLLFFSSYGSPDYYYVVPRSARVWETNSHYYSYTAPTTAFFGVVVVNESGAPAQYVLKVWSDTPVGVGDTPAATATGIDAVMPNPAHGHAQIKFSMRDAGDVSFDVLDMAGRVVSRIPSRHWQPGVWSLDWDGRAEDTSALSPGMYFVQMQVNGRRTGLGRVALVR